MLKFKRWLISLLRTWFMNDNGYDTSLCYVIQHVASSEQRLIYLLSIWVFLLTAFDSHFGSFSKDKSPVWPWSSHTVDLIWTITTNCFLESFQNTNNRQDLTVSCQSVWSSPINRSIALIPLPSKTSSVEESVLSFSMRAKSLNL